MSKPEGPINIIMASLRRLVPEKENLVIACSGGADSMALLFCAQKTGHKLVVVHALHDMRDHEESCKDKDLVEKYCKDNSLKFVQVIVNVRALCYAPTEESYRHEREKLIREAATSHRAIYIATGHHADDQLETILMKLCRGSGLRGFSGISEKHIHKNWTTVRPILSVCKEDLYKICRQNKIPFNEDSTNEDTHYTRNAIRRNVVPELKKLFPKCSEKANDAAMIMTNAQKMADSNLYDLKKHESFSIYDKNCIPNKIEKCVSIPLAALSLSNDITIYEWLRSSFAYVSFTTSKISYDSINKETIDAIIKAIRSGSTKRFFLYSNATININRTEVKFVGWEIKNENISMD